MSASFELSPSTGITSPSARSMRKIAMNASACGNIWTMSRLVRPPRRPAKRYRENAYAAAAPMSTEPTAVAVQTMSVLSAQVQ